MKIHIENILGIPAAAVDVDKGDVLEIVGPNAAGKTSLATCLQALLAREANPLGLPVASMREYAYDGAGECGAWLTHAADTWAVEWVPTRSDGAVTIGADDGTCESHPFAVGLTDFTARMPGKQRSALLQPVLLPDPESVLDRLRKELEPYLPATDIAGCVAEVQRRGWEAGESVYRGRAQEAKRQWCSITKRRQYGSKIAADWRPTGWTADHDALTVVDAEKRLHDAREDRDELLRENAVSEAVLLEAEAARARQPALQEALDVEQQALAPAREARDTARGACSATHRSLESARAEVNRLSNEVRRLRSASAADAPDALCPHCGGALSAQQDMAGSLSIAAYAAGDTETRDREIAERQAELESALAEREAATRIDDEASEASHLADVAYQAALSRRDDARAEFEAARRAGNVRGVPDDERRRRARAAADERVDLCQRTVADVKARSSAADQNDSVEHYQSILRALGPTGVRAGLLDKRLATLNAGLARVSTAAGWPGVTVTAAGAITVERRAAALCSESERWRAQAALQMTIAAMTGSAAVVLDRADLLDAEGRAGLEAAARVATANGRIAVVLCSTGEPAEDPPWRQVVLAGGRTVDPVTGEEAR